MKKSLFLKMFCILCSICCSAQIIKGSNKKYPFVINRVDNSLLSINDFVVGNNAIENFVKSKQYTSEDFKLILSLAKESNFPVGMNTPEKLIARENDINKFKAFYQGSWLQSNKDESAAETYYLFWIPQEDNLFMPKDLVPATANGIYLIMNYYGFDTWKLPLSDEPNADFVKKLKAKHNKTNLYTMDNPYKNIAPGYGIGMEFGFNAMVTYGGYTLQEYARIKQLTTSEYWPAIFSNYKAARPMESIFADMTKYKAYKITTMVDTNGTRDLVWIPKEGNEHMPPEMQPKTNEGFYVAIKTALKDDDYKLFSLRMSTPAGRLNLPSAGKNPNLKPNNNTNISQNNNTTPTNTVQSPTTYTSGNVSTSSYALDIFSELGSMAIIYGSTMYVVKIKGKQMQNVDAVAARANQLLGFTTTFKYQWFAGNNCTTIKSKYGGTMTVICQGEIDLDK